MAELNPLLAPFQKSDTRHAVQQLATSVLPYLLLWVAMALSVKVSYWLTIALMPLAAGFMVRSFIIFHDMGHNSFLSDRKANKVLGFILGVLVLTPAEQWWHSHAIHHATSGNLDKRGVGDVSTLTVDEFIARQWSARLGYKLFRHPLIMFGLGPLYMFLIGHRMALPRYGKKETRSVVYTNLTLLVIAVGVSLLIGWQNFVLIQLGVLLLGGSAGIWLFYVQHQFEEVYWAGEEEWNYVASALLGASYYKLPKLLQWFTGNIGFHHIHHLSPRIPNYNLEKCHNSNPVFSKFAPVLTLSSSFKTANLRLIDVDLRRLVGFAHLRQKRQSRNNMVRTED